MNPSEGATCSKLIKCKDILSYIEPVIFLILGILPQYCKATLVANYGSYKTFLLLSFAMSIASGQDWFGRNVTQRPVLYVVGEHVQGFLRRVIGGTNRILPNIPLYIYPEPIRLLDEEEGVKVEELCIYIEHETGEKPFVILDTLNRNFGDGDENNTRDMTNYMNKLDEHVFPFSCGYILAHHTPKNSHTPRGSNVLSGTIDTEFMLKRTKDDQKAHLKCTKMKDEEPEKELVLRFKKVATGLNNSVGTEVTTLILEDVSYKNESSYETDNSRQDHIVKWLTDNPGFHDIDVLAEKFDELGFSNKANCKTAIERRVKRPGNGVRRDGNSVGIMDPN